MPAKRPTKSKAPVRTAAKAAQRPAAKTAQRSAAKSPAKAAAKRPAPPSTVSALPDAGAVRAHPQAKPLPGKAAARAAGSGAARWAQVTARDIMRERFVTVAYSAPLSDVERVLAENRLLGVPVVDEAGQIMGVLSVKDLMDHYTDDPDSKPSRRHGYFRLASEQPDPEDADAFEDFEAFDAPKEAEDTARDVMSAQVFTVPATAGLKEIADSFCEHKIHRVLVEEDGKLVGLIGTLDILEALRA
jgi:CBS domain-containing protein